MGDGRRRAALVIEDEPDICLLVCDTLRLAGFEPTPAETGAEALELASSLSPDLVTLDLTLPDMDGIEVCRRLRAASDAHVIVLTARDVGTDRRTSLEAGADDYMVKPFSPRDLRARAGAVPGRDRSDGGD